jgi:hypothetical protein
VRFSSSETGTSVLVEEVEMALRNSFVGGRNSVKVENKSQSSGGSRKEEKVNEVYLAEFNVGPKKHAKSSWRVRGSKFELLGIIILPSQIYQRSVLHTHCSKRVIILLCALNMEGVV